MLRWACVHKLMLPSAHGRPARTGVGFGLAVSCLVVPMQTLLVFIGWCILFVLCWPAAILAVLLLPLVWLLALPFRLIGLSVNAVFALLSAVLFLPARVLGYRSCRPVS